MGDVYFHEQNRSGENQNAVAEESGFTAET
jgi:hypothetical protein